MVPGLAARMGILMAAIITEVGMAIPMDVRLMDPVLCPREPIRMGECMVSLTGTRTNIVVMRMTTNNLASTARL